MATNTPKAKLALDKIIRKSRVHLYKPIQIAEILYQNRQGRVSVDDLENYRNPSKRWRDDVSMLLVGRHSTSSQKFQDNLFEDNAMPQKILEELAPRDLLPSYKIPESAPRLLIGLRFFWIKKSKPGLMRVVGLRFLIYLGLKVYAVVSQSIPGHF